MSVKSFISKNIPNALTLEDKAEFRVLPEKLTIGQIVTLWTTDKQEQQALAVIVRDAAFNGDFENTEPSKANIYVEKIHGHNNFFSTIIHDGLSAEINKNDFKKWLIKNEQFPVKDCLLSNWWGDDIIKKPLSFYKKRKEEFIKFENEYSDLNKLTIENIYKSLCRRDKKIWNIKLSTFKKDFWQPYIKERPELKR